MLGLVTPGLISKNQYYKDWLSITFNNLTQIVSENGVFDINDYLQKIMPE